MATRLGIELSAAACRIVEIDGRWRPGTSTPAPRVRSFAVLPPSGRDTEAMLASLSRRDAAVVVWGTPSDHRQVVVSSGSYESMRREGAAALAAVGTNTRGVLVDIAPVGQSGGPRRPVVVALAAGAPMLDAVRPLVAAGIRVRALATPAMALASIAFARRGIASPGAIEAYIAIEETNSCVALMRDGALAIARELPWGYIAHGSLRPREEIAKRLATEMRQYLAAVGVPSASQVCICGGVPELRTMSVLLTEQLDAEVEPLDSLFGIDDSRLPEPSESFRERVSELRLAWAVAADSPPPLNLLRARQRERSRRALAAAAVVAGVAAGVGGTWGISQGHWWTAPARPRAATPSRSARASASAATVRPVAPAPSPLLSRSIVPRAALVSIVRPPEPALTPALRADLERSSAPTAPLRIVSAAPQAPPAVSPTHLLPPPAPASSRRVFEPAPRRSAPAAAPTKPPPARNEQILPFDASLATILYSADRKYAIVDGRIVGVGDLVRGARIVDITQTAVILRDEQGRLRRLAAGPMGR